MSDAAPSLDDAVAALTADRNAFAWTRRAQFVRDAALLLSPGQTAPSSASALLRLLAGDTKWEVRKEVADALHVLPASDFALLAAQLTTDENAFVKGSAERAVERRRRGQNTEAKRRRGLDKVEDDLARLEKSQGAKIARADAGGSLRSGFTAYYDNVSATATPEPASAALLTFGCVGLLSLRRRQDRR